MAGSHIAPRLPLLLVLAYSIVGAAALFVLLTAATVITLTVKQFILRKGGTDPQWFWFAAEPPGLVQLRAELREKKD